MSKTIKILVISSLVLNLLLVGFIAGNISHRFFTEDSFRGKSRELAAKLPPDKKKDFLDTMDKVRLENRDIRRQIRETRERIFNILTAPQFNEASYESETKKLEELRGLMTERLSHAAKELARQFNQEERKILAEHLRRPPRLPRDQRPPPDNPGPPRHP
jgi:uncharacterized membrane protein